MKQRGKAVSMLEKVRTILCEFINNKDFEIGENTALSSDLGINSYQLAELVCVIEDSFNIEIPNKSIASFVSVRDLIEYLELNGN